MQFKEVNVNELPQCDVLAYSYSGHKLIGKLKNMSDIVVCVTHDTSLSNISHYLPLDEIKPSVNISNVQAIVLQRMKEIRDAKTETVVHDILGVARVFQADQSESVNDRHIEYLSNEVVRGIAQQTEAIKKELEVVDMFQLESGDSVKLRNGENRTVIDVFNNGALGRPFGVTINKGTSTASLFYDKNGRYDCVKHGFDIIQIIKPTKCYKSNKPCEFGCNGLCKDA